MFILKHQVPYFHRPKSHLMLYTAEQVAQLPEHTFAHLEVDHSDQVLTLTLNRPEKKNALNAVLMRELAFALAYAHHTANVWVVVLKANGNIFCAGADLKQFAGQKGAETNSTIPEEPSEILMGELFLQVHKPIVAQVHAPLFAGAHLLVCGCTHVVAAESATFSLPEVKRGLWPMQVMASLAPLMSARQLLDYCMRAQSLSAAEAQDLGLATQVAPDDQLEQAVRDLVADILQYSPTAIRLGLKAWDEMRALHHAQAHAFLKTKLNEMLHTEDAKEGLAAFMEKRAPQWTGN